MGQAAETLRSITSNITTGLVQSLSSLKSLAPHMRTTAPVDRCWHLSFREIKKRAKAWEKELWKGPSGKRGTPRWATGAPIEAL